MKLPSVRVQRIAVLIGLFVVSFALYAAAESDSRNTEILLLGLLAALMVATIRAG